MESHWFTLVSLSALFQCVLVTYGIFAVTAAAYLIHRQSRKEKAMTGPAAWAHIGGVQSIFPDNKCLNPWCCVQSDQWEAFFLLYKWRTRWNPSNFITKHLRHPQVAAPQKTFRSAGLIQTGGERRFLNMYAHSRACFARGSQWCF